MSLAEEMVELIWFFDALEAGRACECLEVAEIPFVIEDSSERQQGLHHPGEMPPIQMQIRVLPRDVERAQICLRAQMQLFPSPEVAEGSDELFSDEEVFSEAIVCDESSDAEEASSALTRVGIWSRVQRSVDEEDGAVSYGVEVKGKNIEKAMLVINEWLESR